MKLTDERINEIWHRNYGAIAFARAIEFELAQASEPVKTQHCAANPKINPYTHEPMVFSKEGQGYYAGFTTPQPAPCPRCAELPPISAEIAAGMERTDWTPAEALQFYADGKHFDTPNGLTRILDNGAIASNALKHLSLERLELKGDVELTELQARCAELEQKRRDYINTYAANILALTASWEAKLTAANQQIASYKLLLDECESLINRLIKPMPRWGNDINELLAKLKNRKEGA